MNRQRKIVLTIIVLYVIITLLRGSVLMGVAAVVLSLSAFWFNRSLSAPHNGFRAFLKYLAPVIVLFFTGLSLIAFSIDSHFGCFTVGFGIACFTLITLSMVDD